MRDSNMTNIIALKPNKDVHVSEQHTPWEACRSYTHAGVKTIKTMLPAYNKSHGEFESWRKCQNKHGRQKTHGTTAKEIENKRPQESVTNKEHYVDQTDRCAIIAQKIVSTVERLRENVRCNLHAQLWQGMLENLLICCALERDSCVLFGTYCIWQGGIPAEWGCLQHHVEFYAGQHNIRMSYIACNQLSGTILNKQHRNIHHGLSIYWYHLIHTSVLCTDASTQTRQADWKHAPGSR